jgi:hypothetical protein
MKTSILILAIFVCSVIYAQDSAIYKKGSWRMNGQILKSKELKTEIYKVQEAVPYYKKSRTNIWVSLGTTFLTMAALAIPEYQKDVIPSKTNKLRYVVAGTGLGLGCYFLLKSNSNLHKGIKIRNEKIALTY